LAGLCQHTHTYENLRRDGAFCVNFLSKRYYDALIRTVEHNGPAEDEFAVGGFIEETARTVAVPRIAERFLTLECKCERIEDLSGEGLTAMVIGRVTHMAMAEDYAKGFEDQKYSGNGFFYLIHTPKDLETGEGNHMGIATLCPERKE
jgi:flavin reductase (DIM6/NTAB) family NADH-FMN oxidoreductase RutF